MPSLLTARPPRGAPARRSSSACQVVAFNRNRDAYQVPLALEEAGLLACLVTDFYAPSFPLSDSLPLLRRLNRRRCPGLPFHRVVWSLPALAAQIFRLPLSRSNLRRLRIFKQVDQSLSRTALAEAARRGAGLFLYSGYAREAFTAPEAKGMEKSLFVYHPHGRLCREILDRDFSLYPEVVDSHRLHQLEIDLSDSDRLDHETGAADRILCASSFTRRSLLHAGAADGRITVVPYGCHPDPHSLQEDASRPRGGRCVVLFVGQGVQRKGLHHLLRAWKGLRPAGAELRIVASSLDPGLLPLARQPGVTLLGAQTRERLLQHFREADVFAMPSLVEGFGLVYLEALAAGCFCLGTQNTGLPDLGCPDDAARVLPAGDIDALATALDQTLQAWRGRELDRRRISAFAATRSWDAFRAAIRELFLESRDAPGGEGNSAFSP